MVDKPLQKLHQVGMKFLLPLSFEKLYPLVLNEGIRLTGLKSGVIYLLQKKSLVVVASKGNDPNVNQITEQKWVERSVNQSKVMVTDGGASVPILFNKKVVGVAVFLGDKKAAELRKYFNYLNIFASYVSLAMRKASLFDELSDAISKRDLFISIAAHELKTPITTINGYIQLLKSGMKGSNSQHRRWVDEMSWETYRLIETVNELLQVSRIKTGKLKYSWKQCSLREIINRVILDFKFNHPSHYLKFNDKLGRSKDFVIADFDKLMQVIINIVDNSAKFSAEGSVITLNLDKKSNFLVIEVIDSGKGIAKEDLPQVFKEFYKGGNGHGGGMGLGLFLAKSIIEKHKGKVKISSEKGKGTTIEIALPTGQSSK